MYVIVIPTQRCNELKGRDFGDVERILHEEGFKLEGIEFFLKCDISKQDEIMVCESHVYFAGREEEFCGRTISGEHNTLKKFLEMLEKYILGTHAEGSCCIITPPNHADYILDFFRSRGYGTNVQTSTQLRTRL